MMIQTTSTKCQYRPTISTVSALSPGILFLRDHRPSSTISMMMPTDDVDTVETGEGVEARREQALGVAEALTVERRELVHLPGDEETAEQWP